MKKKVFIGIVLIIILLLVPTVFAKTSNTTNTTENVVQNGTEKSSNSISSNTENEISEEDLIPALEEKLKQQQNATINTTNSTDIIDEDTEILSDIYIAESEEELLYENVYIDGNVYIVSSEKVTLKNSRVSGNIFIVSKSFDLDGTRVDGSLYIIANEINFTESKVTSIYSVSNIIEIDENSQIVNDIRAVAKIANVDGDIGRESYIKIEDVNVDIYKAQFSFTIQDLLPEILVKFIIILIAAIIILGGSPKFVKVNFTLKIRSFFKAFFTGILEILIITAIAVLIMMTGYGIGYALGILALLGVLLCFGKIIFIVAFGLRLVKNQNKNSRVKAFIFTIFVAVVVQALELLPALGMVGFLASLVIDIVLGITGLGTLIRVVLTARKKKPLEQPKTPNYTSPVQIVTTPEPEEKVENSIKEDTKIEVPKEEAIEIKTKEEKTEKLKTTGIFEITGQIVKKEVVSEEEKESKEEVEPKTEELDENKDSKDK